MFLYFSSLILIQFNNYCSKNYNLLTNIEFLRISLNNSKDWSGFTAVK